MAKSKIKTKTKALKPNGDAQVLPKVQRVIARQLKSQPEKIKLTSHLQNDLGADSLDAMEILFGLEEEFGLKIPEDDARRISTVQDAVDYVTKRLRQ